MTHNQQQSDASTMQFTGQYFERCIIEMFTNKFKCTCRYVNSDNNFYFSDLNYQSTNIPDIVNYISLKFNNQSIDKLQYQNLCLVDNLREQIQKYIYSKINGDLGIKFIEIQIDYLIDTVEKAIGTKKYISGHESSLADHYLYLLQTMLAEILCSK